jgi:long-subunit acyl-CoA synthetase (AMP-forming)
VAVLPHGEHLYAAGLENKVAACPGVSAVFVGGQDRARPSALVEWKNCQPADVVSLADWQQALNQVNESCSDLVNMCLERVYITHPGKDLIRT